MLLRSSSTPVLGSLLSSFSDSPSHHGHHETAAPVAVAAMHKPALHHNHHNHHSFSFQPKGSLNLTTISCNSSPISSHDLGDTPNHHKGGTGGFRRAQSDSNLEGLAYNMSPLNSNEDQFHTMSHAKKSSARPRCMTLETIPSFSFYRYGHGREDEDEENSDFDIDEGGEYEEYEEASLVKSCVKFRGSKSMSLIAEEESSSVGSVNTIEKSSFEENKERVRQEMYLAIGIGGGGGDGSSRGFGGSNSSDDSGDGGDNQGVEEYYKKMVEESPNNSLFLRNYAQFLYQKRGDLERAEEYYARANLADPQDGEILSQYAKLVWELHRDQPRASTYFDRAVQASPEDSHVQAAYASFLWEIDEDDKQGEDEEEEEEEASLAAYAMSPQFQGRATASVGT
ncbi:hypothetical protein BT93_A0282 [Corymbia citriodora subsp. variegata]|nr:hypothetical protein BT93_A0282 [Corymbia citriodora subsp. variegata]